MPLYLVRLSRTVFEVQQVADGTAEIVVEATSEFVAAAAVVREINHGRLSAEVDFDMDVYDSLPFTEDADIRVAGLEPVTGRQPDLVATAVLRDDGGCLDAQWVPAPAGGEADADILPVGCCAACKGSGVFVAEDREVLGLGCGWVQRCDVCGRHATDLDAMNAARASRGLPALRGYPFSLVAADWGEYVEQRFTVRLDVAISLAADAPETLSDAGDLEAAVMENLVDWLAAAISGGRWNGGDVAIVACDPIQKASDGAVP